MYQVKQYINSGSCSKVYTGYHHGLKQNIAIKTYENITCELLREVVILENTDNDHIVKLYDINTEGDTIHLLLEQCDYSVGDMILHQYEFSLNEIIKLCKNVIIGLLHLKQHGYNHNDISPKNIMYKNGKYKLIDFGFSTNNFIKNTPIELCLPPELMNLDNIDIFTVDIFAVDIWSLGSILYLLASHKILEYKHEQEYIDAQIDKLPYELSWLIKGMLQINPKNRFTVENIVNKYDIKTHNKQVYDYIPKIENIKWEKTIQNLKYLLNDCKYFKIFQEPESLEFLSIILKFCKRYILVTNNVIEQDTMSLIIKLILNLFFEINLVDETTTLSQYIEIMNKVNWNLNSTDILYNMKQHNKNKQYLINMIYLELFNVSYNNQNVTSIINTIETLTTSDIAPLEMLEIDYSRYKKYFK